MAIMPVYGESLLKPTAFPKTFDDVPFVDRWAVLAEGYGAFDKVYDADGRCISGCPYVGLTIEQDQENTEEATNYFSNLIDGVISGADNVAGVDDTNFDNISGGNNIENSSDAPIRPGQDSLPLRSPVSEPNILLTSDFGWRKLNGKQYMHNGIDIGVATGTPIYAAGDGTVQSITTGCRVGDKTCGGGNGNYVLIQHAYGLYSEYKHLNSVNVSKGNSVRAGQLIGYSGNTGYSFGSHLHYDIYVYKNGAPAFIDILCPCAGTRKTKSYNESLANINTGYSCKHCALNRQYKFNKNEKKVEWRIASGHCMTKPTDKLPDEQ